MNDAHSSIQGQSRGLPLPLILLMIAPATVTAKDASPVLECELYIAESTIPNAGLGIFSSVEKKVGDYVGNGDVAFPLLELDWHNGLATNYVEEYYNPFEDYVWDGITMGMGNECEETVTALWPGLDCAINCNIPLENVKRAFPKHSSHGDSVADFLPHRSKDPGAGAVTTYRSGMTMVTRDIPPGGELFKFYGDEWYVGNVSLRTNIAHEEERFSYIFFWICLNRFLTRASEFAGFDQIPLKDDFPRAQRLLKDYHYSKFPSFVYDTILEIRDVWKNARTLNAIPHNLQHLQTAFDSDITNLHQPNATRSLEWLQQHGKCVDHIIPKPSTIPGAGEGAFAKRNLPQGTIITASPIHVIPNESFLWMYNFEPINDDDDNKLPTYDDDDDDDDTILKVYNKTLLTKQVMYNYCLGHPDSTMLLFPYGSGVHYINHSPTPNVKIQWSQDGTIGMNETWLQFAPEDFDFDYGTHLAINYIALRDIAEGEELFMDYGPEWSQAWKKHVELWNPPSVTTIAADWNDLENSNNLQIRTTDDQESNPYPQTIELRCHVNLIDPDWQIINMGWERYISSEDEYAYVYGLPCHILERSSENLYKVKLISDDDLLFKALGDDFKPNAQRSEVPREAIFFLDATYESDLYLPNTFRHTIGIPNDMVPDIWKTKNESHKDDDDDMSPKTSHDDEL